MTCVACGYQPTEKERLEQPYACPKCEPETWRPTLAEGFKACVKSLAKKAVGKCAAQVPFRSKPQQF